MTDTSGPEFDVDLEATIPAEPSAKQVIVIGFDRLLDDEEYATIMNRLHDAVNEFNPTHATVAIKEAADKVLRLFEPEQQSNLVDHARYEMELIGEDPETIDHICNVIRAFADGGHSGGSASVAIPRINELLQFKNLTPLTDDPLEWMHIAEDQWGEPGGVWQNRRRSEAFSNDGGKTYYLLSERDNETGDIGPIHMSVHKPTQEVGSV